MKLHYTTTQYDKWLREITMIQKLQSSKWSCRSMFESRGNINQDKWYISFVGVPIRNVRMFSCKVKFCARVQFQLTSFTFLMGTPTKSNSIRNVSMFSCKTKFCARIQLQLNIFTFVIGTPTESNAIRNVEMFGCNTKFCGRIQFQLNISTFLNGNCLISGLVT